jgi:2-dehydro-3-deoxyphosphogluconate aldolase/(4S)-4-hydroxy-2-oxoglutarate aldolase
MVSGAIAAAKGGVHFLAVPASVPGVAEIVAELADAGDDIHVGISGVMDADQVSLALAMDARFIMSPICNPEVVRGAADRGLLCVAGAATFSEISAAASWSPDLLQVFPAGLLGGPRYFHILRRNFPQLQLVAGGEVDVDTGPNYLEAGAAAIVIDHGLIPDRREAEAEAIITARAAALVEVCHEIGAAATRHSHPG